MTPVRIAILHFMPRRILSAGIVAISLGAILFTAECRRPRDERSVVVYTSVDQVFSEPILNTFSAITGIRVLPVFDVEAAKTTGLVSRLIAEKNYPQADVFWSGEFAQTLLLKEKGLLAAYDSSVAAGIPLQYRDPDHYWTAFAPRARVWIINTNLVPSSAYPKSIYDVFSERYPADKIGIANPLFGTAATHAAALYSVLGAAAGRAFFERARRRGIRVVDGNAVVRDMVASGQLMMGLTDTDDACGAKQRGDPVAVVVPDQGENDLGTLLVPNTVALISGGAHPKEGRELIDFILQPEVERRLVEAGWCHFPLHQTEARPACLAEGRVKAMEARLLDVYRQMQQSKLNMTEIFVR
jgi:iron(III) transport system substrate-binding protein